MAHLHTPFRGYAKLPRYQYATLNQHSFQYSHLPLYAPPPDPPPFEPPADHPVEKDDEAVAHDEAEDPPAAGSDSPAGEVGPTEDEDPETALVDETLDEVPAAEPICEKDPPDIPEDGVPVANEQTQASSGSIGDAESTVDITPIDPSLNSNGDADDGSGPKEADFPPIEPGEVDEDVKANEPAANLLAEEAVEAAPSTTPEAAPSVGPTPDTAITEQTPPATEEPADDKPGKKSKKSSRTKEKESKSKIKAKEKEKEKVRGKEKENERAKSNGRKKKGKSKVDSVVIPADEPRSSPEASCPSDDAIAETQAEPVADPTTETIADPSTETSIDPPTEPPTAQIVESEVPQSEGVIADAPNDPLDEKSTEPDQVPKHEEEATEATDTQTKDLTSEEATAAHGIEDNLNNDVTAPDLQGTQPSETTDDDAGADDESKATQPSLRMDADPAEPPLTAQDTVAADAPIILSDTNPSSVPADVEVVEVIEAVATETTPEASPADIPDDSTQPGNEKFEIIEPVLEDEELKTEEQPDKVPESETAAPMQTDEAPTANTTDEAPQSEVVLESPSEVTQAEESKGDDQPIGTPPAETAGTTSQDPPPEGPIDPAAKAVQAEEEKVEAIEPSLAPGDANADEKSVNVAQDEATIVETEAVDNAIEDGVEPSSSAAEPVLETVPDVTDEKDEKTIEDKIQETPAPDDSPIQSVPAAESEKAVETSPAEEPPIVEQIASTEDPFSAPGVETTHNQELAQQANVESAASEPTLVEEPTAEPTTEVAPSADIPPSPSSEKHRKKKVTGWERQRRYSKTSTAGSDLSGSTTKKSPSSDKPPSESTTTNQKRHSSKRTFELNFAGMSGEYGKSERPKISRSSTSRRSHRKDREPEPAARPRIFERAKTETDGRVQYRVNDTAPERPSRRRAEESFRREHRSDKHRDGERHREREKDREKEKEKEREKREKAREEARAHDEEKERKKRQEDEERRERRRRRRDEEDGKRKDGEGQDRHHRHRGGHDKEKRRTGSSPPPAMKIGKSLGSGLRRLLAI
ncbi:MAG: hypothetical protein LQ337_006157 [Flavoplaca oasis]|nr:MAG: hypothetical protein LQ337_006157 [Flavoplaca oasis]